MTVPPRSASRQAATGATDRSGAEVSWSCERLPGSRARARAHDPPAENLGFDDYLKSIGDDTLVIDMLVGDLQRIIEYPARGFAIAQEVPGTVTGAYRRLIAARYVSRLTRD
jgi:hypothetical protein